jgi:glucose-6-phosphate 1-dehydrogenase
MTVGRLAVLGAGGDLTGRYLLPALGRLEAAGRLPAGLGILGVGLSEWDRHGFRRYAQEHLGRFAADLPAEAVGALCARLDYRHGDVADPGVLEQAASGADGPVVWYLALPPAVFGPVARALGSVAMPEGSRIVVEKPFGTDLASAQQLNRALAEVFGEERIFRVDHFLGMPTVQNLLGIRFGNRVFEPLWCADHVEAVDVVWDETVALEGRAGYYDRTGALRDMVQNHLLQLLALVAMERPRSLGEADLRDAKEAVLQRVRRLSRDEVDRCTVRARYGPGEVGGRRLPAYADSEGVRAERGTETFAQVTLFVDGDRWSGVPFRLRTGKALGADRREIVVHFREVDPSLFSPGEQVPPNRLRMTMDPDRLVLDIALNGSGDPFRLEPARLSAECPPEDLPTYARLLLGVFDGDPRLSIRRDEVEESWRIVEPIVAAWADGAAPLGEYPAGSGGPEAAPGTAGPAVQLA